MEDKQGLKLTVTVDIGNGLTDQLCLTDRDEVKTCAAAFGRKHHLGKHAIVKLQALLEQNLRASQRYLSSKTAFLHSHSVDSPNTPRSSVINRLFDRTTKRINVPEAVSYSFSPHINPHSHRTRKTEEILLEQGQKSQERLRLLRNSHMRQELTNCPFRPAVNPRSARLDMKRSSGSPRHEVLFKLAGQRTEPTLESQGEKDKVRRPTEELLARLSTSKLGFQARMQKLKQELEAPFDPATRQPFFSPKTNTRGPAKRDSRPAHERLSIPRRPPTTSESTSIPQPSVTGMSLGLVQDFRQRQVQKLFRMLDSDRDGVINSATVEVGGLSDRAFLLLEPLWLHLRDLESDMRQEEFEERVGSLVGGLTVEERHFLLSGLDRDQPQPEPMSQTPQFSSLSLALAEDRYAEVDAYTKQLTEWKDLQERVELQRKEKQAKELAQCSFRPRTTKYVRH